MTTQAQKESPTHSRVTGPQHSFWGQYPTNVATWSAQEVPSHLVHVATAVAAAVATTGWQKADRTTAATVAGGAGRGVVDGLAGALSVEADEEMEARGRTPTTVSAACGRSCR